MKKTALISTFLLCTTLMFAGCANGPSKPSPNLQRLNPAAVAAVPINVAQINVSSSQTKAVNADFAVPPDEAAEDYFKRRFRADGSIGTLEVLVEAANVNKDIKEPKEKVAQFLGVAKMERYEIALSIRLEHKNIDGQVVYGTSVQAKRIVSFSEHVSLNEREQIQRDAIETLFGEMDPKIQRIVLQDMRLRI